MPLSSLPPSLPRPAMRHIAPILALVLAFVCALTPPGARAAPQVEDSMAQRMQACTGCHGPQGRAASDGYYPRIAGKPAGYLYNQLLSFRDGRRHYALMQNLLAPLSDAYLREIADYFSGLSVPYPPPQRATAGVDRLTRGQQLVLEGDPDRKLPACIQCHGAGLMGVVPAIPALLGMPRDYLNAQLGAWRTAGRQAMPPDCMADVARHLAPEDIGAVSQWLAAQAVPPGRQAGAGAAGSLAAALRRYRRDGDRTMSAPGRPECPSCRSAAWAERQEVPA